MKFPTVCEGDGRPGSRKEMLDQLERMLRKIAIEEDEGAYRAARIMMAAVFVGPNVEKVMEVTGYSGEEVNEIAFRLRSSRLWTAERTNYLEWSAEGRGYLNFSMDLLVARGLLVRTQRMRKGQPVYIASEYERLSKH